MSQKLFHLIFLLHKGFAHAFHQKLSLLLGHCSYISSNFQRLQVKVIHADRIRVNDHIGKNSVVCCVFKSNGTLVNNWVFRIYGLSYFGSLVLDV